MKLFIKFDINKICAQYLEEKLQQLDFEYKNISFGEIEVNQNFSNSAIEKLNNALSPHGFNIVENQKSVLIQKIKDVIVEMVFNDENAINVKSSVYISEKLNLSFGHLSNLFSEITYTSIENFIIIQKIERVKQLIIINELSLTEIAYLLSYSSVAHLSTQFKNTTGITASAFQRIIEKRRKNLNQ